MLKEFGPSFYYADGPEISFYGLMLPIRMAVARLADGKVWVWSPIPLSDKLAEAVEALGPVSYVVSPNKIHHLYMGEWAERWPEARLYAPPGLAKKEPQLHFYADLTDAPDPAWSDDIDQVIFKGSVEMEEVVFFHRASRTAILGDLIERNDPENVSHLQAAVMRLGGVAGEHGTTPIDWRASWLNREPARAARQKVLDWNPEQMLIAHGECARTGATPIIKEALSWM